MTAVASPGEERHLAVSRGRPLGRKVLGKRGRSGSASAGALDLHSGARGEKRPSPGVQDLGKRLQLTKEVLNDDSEISFSLASNKRICQSNDRMGMSRD